MLTTNSSELRFYVKIRKSHTIAALADVSYYRNDMTFEFYMRWKWYFEYRAALYRVNEPRAYVEFSHGSYEYVLPDVIYKEKLTNLIRAARAKITQNSRKLNQVKLHWNQLFPIEDDPNWQKVCDKFEYYEKRLADLLHELELHEKR